MPVERRGVNVVFEFTVDQIGLFPRYVGCFVPLSIQNMPFDDVVVMSADEKTGIVRISMEGNKINVFMGLVPDIVGICINEQNAKINDLKIIESTEPIVAYLMAEEVAKLVYEPKGANPLAEVVIRRDELAQDILNHPETLFFSVEEFVYEFNENDISDQGRIAATDMEGKMRAIAKQNEEEKCSEH